MGMTPKQAAEIVQKRVTENAERIGDLIQSIEVGHGHKMAVAFQVIDKLAHHLLQPISIMSTQGCPPQLLASMHKGAIDSLVFAAATLVSLSDDKAGVGDTPIAGHAERISDELAPFFTKIVSLNEDTFKLARDLIAKVHGNEGDE